LFFIGVPIGLGWGVQAVVMRAVLVPGCTERCAARGQSMLFVVPSQRGGYRGHSRGGGCVCQDGTVVSWQAPDTLAHFQAALFPIIFVLGAATLRWRGRRGA
jgi:hypothetical protein